MNYTYVHKKLFTLENGFSFESLHLTYTIIGNLQENKKIVWVFHALTANSDPSIWWNNIVGDNYIFNKNDYTIICVNIPGSCYGSEGPLSINPKTNSPYYHNFPVFSIVDIVHAFQLIKEELKITSINIGIGASMGAQHLLQWAIIEPNLFENIIPIASNSKQSAYGLAMDAAQRLAIEADCTWQSNTATAGLNGLKAARAMAMVLYRTYQSFEQKNTNNKGNAETYQRYQALKITERFNAYSYYNLSLSRNTHNVDDDLHKITANTLVIGFKSDNLFPIEEQMHLASKINNATLQIADSIYGHDAFLVETELITQMIKSFLKMQNEIQKLKDALSNLDAEQALLHIATQFKTDAVFSTSFGIEDQAITNIIAKQQLAIPIFTLDTGRLFSETYSTWDATLLKYKLKIKAYYPNSETLQSFIEQNGPNSFYDSIENRKNCCAIRKVAPLQKALQGKKIWITGIRAEQSLDRKMEHKIEWDASNNIIKFHPILDWNFEKLLQYIKVNEVPVNALHHKGFVSIGCAPCTRAIKPGEDFRAGRWWWEDTTKKECGLHSH